MPSDSLRFDSSAASSIRPVVKVNCRFIRSPASRQSSIVNASTASAALHGREQGNFIAFLQRVSAALIIEPDGDQGGVLHRAQLRKPGGQLLERSEEHTSELQSRLD